MISQKRISFVLLTFAVLLTSFMAVSATAPSPPIPGFLGPPVLNYHCPYNESQYDYVISNFIDNPQKILSDSALNHSTSNVSVNIPSGIYDVYEYAWDGYVGRENDSQPYERFVTKFYDNQGNLIATSNQSTDLQDNVSFADWSGLVNSNLVLSTNIYDVQGWHPDWYNGDSANSVFPGCIALKRIPLPTCSVDYIKNKDSLNIYSFNAPMTYINENGDYIAYGNASSFGGSTVSNVQYNRTSPNTYISLENTLPSDGYFNEPEEDWQTDEDNPLFIDGVHTICCRAADSVGSVGNFADSCTSFCIDETAPGIPSVSFDNPSKCEPNYVNEAPQFSWSLEDNGCAPVSYEVEVYFSNGTLYYSVEDTNQTSLTIVNPTNGQDYYIKVRAKDAAGNVGTWSVNSTHVYYDHENPKVKITQPEAGFWTNEDFLVNETDTDNLGLYQCEYKILNEGNKTVGWTVLPCNSAFTVNISEVCSVDELCHIYKRVTDLACNTGKTSRSVYLDRTPPNTTKIVGEPKVAPFTTQWINQLIRGFFVNDHTSITLNCDDSAGVGCDAIYYNITYNGTTTTHVFNTTSGASDSTTFNLDQGDGLYNITYWSVDKLGNVESPKWEIDKVDTLPPTTTKTIGVPKYLDNQGKLWVNGYTTLSLVCNDTEVGCNMSSYQVDYGAVNSNDSSNGTAYNFTLGSYGDGEHFVQYWSNDSLNNTEAKKNETDWVDTHFPLIWVQNPTASEAGDVTFCEQSIAVDAKDVMNVLGEDEILESGSGLNESTIHADLYNESGLVRENITLAKSDYGTYEGMMDKQLPAGNYTLKIYATDNVNNTNVVEINETLKDGVYVEPIGGIKGCSVNSQEGGNCSVQFNVCVRGYSGIQFWMNKIGGQLTPGNLSATITNSTGGSAVVGLEHTKDYDESGCVAYGQSLEAYNKGSTYWNGTACLYQSNAGVLPLSCSEINGKTSFGLNFNISQQLAQEISQNTVEYWIGPSYSNCSLQQED